jgi:hypothetical protein
VELVSALCEQDRVHQVDSMPHLGDQMCAFTIDFNRKEMRLPQPRGRVGLGLDRVDDRGRERRLLIPTESAIRDAITSLLFSCESFVSGPT